jgi:hypothetical protein
VNRLIAAAGQRNPSDFGRDDQIGPILDRMLFAGDAGPALSIWRRLADAKWLGVSSPTATHPLTNGNFDVPSFRHGFDWLPAACTGASVEQLTDTKEVRITFSGNEPEHCTLLQQYVPLDPNRQYQLAWKAEAQGIDSPSGLAWRLYPVPNQKQLFLGGRDLLAESEQIWDFQSPADRGLSLLSLEYHRPLGRTRITGNLSVKAVSLEPR